MNLLSLTSLVDSFHTEVGWSGGTDISPVHMTNKLAVTASCVLLKFRMQYGCIKRQIL